MMRSIGSALARAGVEVHVATLEDDDEKDRPPGRLGTPHQVDGVTYWYFKRSTRFYQTSLRLTQWLRLNTAQFDLVHIHSVFNYPAAIAGYWARRYHIPYVVRPLGVLNHWGMENRRPRFKRISLALVEKPLFFGAAAVQFTSEQELAEAAAVGVCERAVIVPNPVETVRIRRTRSSRDRKVILFLSRLNPKKGIDLLLKAYQLVLKEIPQAELVVAGSGAEVYVAALKQLTTRLGISEKVSWPGHLEGAEKQAAYQDADLFVLPSHSENFGVAAVEAMSAGIPTIISDHVGVAAEAAAARAAVTVPLDEKELANAILGILADPERAQLLSERGREFADQYSSENVVCQLLALYGRILRRPQPGLDITPVVLTYNEEPNIARTLKALNWAKRIVVVDSGSDDATEQIVRSFPNTEWHVRHFDSWAGQWTHAFHRTGIATEWVLALDADMIVPAEFVQECQAKFLKGRFSSARIPFVYCTGGRPLLGSLYPPDFRLFRPSEVQVTQVGHKHQFSTPAPVYQFSAHLLHDDRKSLDRWVQSQLGYSLHEQSRMDAAKHRHWKDTLRRTGLMPLVAGCLAYIRSGGPLKGRAALEYAYQRFTFETLLAMRLLHPESGETSKSELGS